MGRRIAHGVVILVVLLFPVCLPAGKKEVSKKTDYQKQINLLSDFKINIQKGEKGNFVWKKGNKRLALSYKKLMKHRYQMFMTLLPVQVIGEFTCINSFCEIDWRTICYSCLIDFFSDCGNGTVEAEEQCDDGNDRSLDGCTPQCRYEYICGDGVLERGEECDDGNQLSGDGCTFDCKIQQCGNGVIEPYETCDDGNEVSGDGCGDRCVIECTLSERRATSYHCPSTCGNGVLERGERCDDGNLVSLDGCSGSCEPDEPLSTPDPADCYACSAGGSCEAISASESVCLLFYDEPTCGGDCAPVPVCGNDVVEAGEICDDGNLIDDDLCTNACRFPDEIVEDCEDPERAALEPGTRLRVYDDSTHISRCETGTSVRYIICGDDGEITVGINDCEDGFPCVDGACVEELVVEPTCDDTDGDNRDTRGATHGTEADGDSFADYDICTIEGTAVYEYICLGGESTVRTRGCDDGEVCRNESVVDPVDGAGSRVIGACEPGELSEWVCADTDGDNRDTRGAVHGTEPDGDSFANYDLCTIEGTAVYEYICLGGEPASRVRECDDGEVCRNESVVDPVDGVGSRVIGACEPGELSEWVCTDTDGDNHDTRGAVHGTEPDGDSFANYDLCTIDGTAVYEYICVGGEPTSRTRECDDGEVCRSESIVDPVDGVGSWIVGACTSGRCTCSRTAPTATAAGFVTGVDCVIQHDICHTRADRSFELVQYGCNGEGLPTESLTVLCPDGCEDGRCL